LRRQVIAEVEDSASTGVGRRHLVNSEGELPVLGVGVAEAVGERLLAGRIGDGNEVPRPEVRFVRRLQRDLEGTRRPGRPTRRSERVDGAPRASSSGARRQPRWHRIPQVTVVY
jgi:hypothetical protein